MFQGCLHRCSHRAPCLEGPRLGFMLCCHHLEILNNFLTEGSWIFFFFPLDPTNYVAGPACYLGTHNLHQLPSTEYFLSISPYVPHTPSTGIFTTCCSLSPTICLCLLFPLLCVANSYSRTQCKCHLLFKIPLCKCELLLFACFVHIYKSSNWVHS